MQILAPISRLIVAQWFPLEKPWYQEWDLWLAAGTLLLAAFTLWLALETRGLRRDSIRSIQASEKSAKIAHQQLQAALQPVPELSVVPRFHGNSMDEGQVIFHYQLELLVNNVGPGPFKMVTVKLKSEKDFKASYSLILAYSDLGMVMDHTFLWSPGTGMLHKRGAT